MDSDQGQELLRSELVRHPVTGEAFMIDRDAAGQMLALAGPLRARRVFTSHGPRALISLGATVDWFVRPADADDPDLEDENVVGAVLAWAAGIAWQPVADYRRVDEFANTASADEDGAGDSRFVRTVYLLESVVGADSASETNPGFAGAPGPLSPAPPNAEPPQPLWSGPGPVSLG